MGWRYPIFGIDLSREIDETTCGGRIVDPLLAAWPRDA
jgi:hypothetical protein